MIDGDGQGMTVREILWQLQTCMKIHSGDALVFVQLENGSNFVPTSIGSFRGSFCCPALRYSHDSHPITVAVLIEIIERDMADSHEGFKGGLFEFGKDHILYAANYGSTAENVISEVRFDPFSADKNVYLVVSEEEEE